VGHAHCKALAETAVLTFVSVLLLDLAFAFALVVLQFESDGSPEEALWKIHKRLSKNCKSISIFLYECFGKD